MAKLTYADVMKMNEGAFFALVINEGAQDWMKDAIKRKEVRKSYPRKAVMDEYGNPIKKLNKSGKEYTVTEADKSKKPSIKHSPISFFSIKKAFCVEVLHIEKVAQEDVSNFRMRFEGFLEELENAEPAE